ncbi:MAG: GNAT family N-acetyltransferase [Oscillospiraceae bacterium]|nr:GNAT family N-acetyltransferase [Oscillospiraceae bacterium]
MKKRIVSILAREGITQVGFLPFRDSRVINPHLVPSGAESVILLLAPYDCGEPFTDGVSAYAHIDDYHRFYEELYARLCPALEEAFPGASFWGFADHSPIDEKDASAKAGLGVLGSNSLLINPVYGSYVFIGSLLTDLSIPCQAQEVRYCPRCGACKAACPVGAVTDDGILAERCLSALSQKKRLTEEEKRLLAVNGVAWGCDRCQTACPYNQKRAYTSLPFFLAHRHGNYTADEVEAMDGETFSRYPFSWRGRGRIVENLRGLEQAHPIPAPAKERDNITVRNLTSEELHPQMLQTFTHKQNISAQWVKNSDRWVLQKTSLRREWSDEKRIWVPQYLRHQLDRGGAVIGAFCGNRLVGFACIDGILKGNPEKYTNLTMLFVDDDWKRKGIGKALFRQICQCAAKQKADKIFISAVPSYETVSFYFAMGCSDAKVKIDNFIDTEEDRYLEYPLKEKDSILFT